MDLKWRSLWATMLLDLGLGVFENTDSGTTGFFVTLDMAPGGLLFAARRYRLAQIGGDYHIEVTSTVQGLS